MLVLSRKRQQQIRIGDNITISVLKIQGNTVRIGIEAPREIGVVRGELPVFSGGHDADGCEDAASQECASTADDEPAAFQPASPALQRYLRLRRRRRARLQVLAG